MDIEKVKRRLLIKYPLFGSIVANSNFVLQPLIKTAATDGDNIYYNPEFTDKLSDDEQVFLLAHEVYHIAFNHIFRSEGKDKELWNIATDAVANAALKRDGLPIIKGGVDIPEAINYDAEEMYKKLLEEKRQQQQQNEQSNGQSGQGDKQQSSSSGEISQEQDKQSQEQSGDRSGEDSQEEEKQQDVGHDTHSMWDKAIEKRKQEEKNYNEGQNKDQEKNEQIKKLTELGEKRFFKQNKIERKKQLEELRKAIVSQSHGYGNDTNSERRNITDIGTSESLIDWRRLLKEAVKYDIDWSYQNAEIEEGVVTAHLEEIPRPETEIVLDTSGSVKASLLRNFLRECKNILQNSKVKVGCFDVKFYGFTEIKDVSDVDNLEFYGGGGTNFNVAVNAFTRRVENKIIFTDGCSSMPDTPLDAIWVVFGNKHINPKGGRVININGKQLENLYNYEIPNIENPKTR